MNLALVGRVLFPASALSSLFLAWCAWQSVTVPTEQLVLGVGLPDLPVHLRRDGLASVFLLLLGVASAGISTFAGGYFRQGEGTPPGLLCLHYHLFLCSMGLVLLADDAYAFMVAWETMALTSYFLVTTQHRIPEIRQAGFIYLGSSGFRVGNLCAGYRIASASAQSRRCAPPPLRYGLR